MATPILKFAHIPDIAWIIALWKAIHGGDPAPDDQVAAAKILAAAAGYLSGQATNPVAVETLAKRFKAMGTEVTVAEAEMPRTERLQMPGGFTASHFIQICFGVGAHRQCLVVEVPGPRPF